MLQFLITIGNQRTTVLCQKAWPDENDRTYEIVVNFVAYNFPFYARRILESEKLITAK